MRQQHQHIELLARQPKLNAVHGDGARGALNLAFGKREHRFLMALRSASKNWFSSDQNLRPCRISMMCRQMAKIPRICAKPAHPDRARLCGR